MKVFFQPHIEFRLTGIVPPLSYLWIGTGIGKDSWVFQENLKMHLSINYLKGTSKDAPNVSKPLKTL